MIFLKTIIFKLYDILPKTQSILFFNTDPNIKCFFPSFRSVSMQVLKERYRFKSLLLKLVKNIVAISHSLKLLEGRPIGVHPIEKSNI